MLSLVALLVWLGVFIHRDAHSASVHRVLLRCYAPSWLHLKHYWQLPVCVSQGAAPSVGAFIYMQSTADDGDADDKNGDGKNGDDGNSDSDSASTADGEGGSVISFLNPVSEDSVGHKFA